MLAFVADAFMIEEGLMNDEEAMMGGVKAFAQAVGEGW